LTRKSRGDWAEEKSRPNTEGRGGTVVVYFLSVAQYIAQITRGRGGDWRFWNAATKVSNHPA